MKTYQTLGILVGFLLASCTGSIDSGIDSGGIPAPTNEDLQTGLVVVDFWAPWCGPCRTMNPIYKKVSETLKDSAKFYKVNIDEQGDLSDQFNIRSIPTILILKDGKVVDQKVGVVSGKELTKAVQKWVSEE